MTKVLTVCLGNICRSPAAQGILQAKADEKGIELVLDSAGTAAYHVGNPPDTRSIGELSRRGIDISKQRARQFAQADFEEFDWILPMDHSNLNNLMRICPEHLQYKVQLFGGFSADSKIISQYGEEVADPYYGNDKGFVDMADHLELLAESFLQTLSKTESHGR